MRRMLSVVLTLAFMGVGVQATDLNLSVQSDGGLSEITVAPGATVNYKVMGILSDDLNEGLALFGLDLVFDGGDLEQANSPVGEVDCLNPIPTLVIPEGITNPAGFGGTVIGGDLIQIGGGQNTIKNTEANADFPIGMVLLGVAQPAVCGEAVLVTGSLVAPLVEGAYNLTIPLNSVFANVIRESEVIENVFLATDAAGVGTVSNLIINVGGDVPTVLTATVPLASAPGELAAETLWRSSKSVMRFTFGDDIVAPTAGQVEVREMLSGGTYGADLSASMTFDVESDGLNPRVLRIADTGATLQHRTWYAIINNGWPGVSPFEAQYAIQVGDANNDGRVQFNDFAFINASMGQTVPDDHRSDINGDGRIQFNDLAAANTGVGSDILPKPAGH